MMNVIIADGASLIVRLVVTTEGPIDCYCVMLFQLVMPDVDVNIQAVPNSHYFGCYYLCIS